jgi:hypothetical protein
MEKKHYWLPSFDGRLHERMTAEDLMAFGIPRSTAYRAIQRQTLPNHRLRDLQFKVFGQLPGWEGWRILPGKIVSPNGQSFDHCDLENLAYLRQVLTEYDIRDLPLKQNPIL